LDRRRLARAVGSEEPIEAAARHGEVDAIDRDELAEALAQVVGLEGELHRAQTLAGARLPGCPLRATSTQSCASRTARARDDGKCTPRPDRPRRTDAPPCCLTSAIESAC